MSFNILFPSIPSPPKYSFIFRLSGLNFQKYATNTMHDTCSFRIIDLDLIVLLSMASVTGYSDGCRLSVR
jgi:hypothetical protein